MSDTTVNQAAATDPTVHLDLSPAETALVGTALRVLLSTLGREEAEEIDEIQALLAKLSDAS